MNKEFKSIKELEAKKEKIRHLSFKGISYKDSFNFSEYSIIIRALKDVLGLIDEKYTRVPMGREAREILEKLKARIEGNDK